MFFFFASPHLLKYIYTRMQALMWFVLIASVRIFAVSKPHSDRSVSANGVFVHQMTFKLNMCSRKLVTSASETLICTEDWFLSCLFVCAHTRMYTCTHTHTRGMLPRTNAAYCVECLFFRSSGGFDILSTKNTIDIDQTDLLMVIY